MSKFMQAKWANYENDTLSIDANEQPIQMAKSQGTGKPLVSGNGFGADIIQFSAGKCVESHTHKGDHILLVLTGIGTVSYFDEIHNLYPGMVYYIPGNAPHAIHAKSNLVLIAVGNDHRPVNCPTRLEMVARN